MAITDSHGGRVIDAVASEARTSLSGLSLGSTLTELCDLGSDAQLSTFTEYLPVAVAKQTGVVEINCSLNLLTKLKFKGMGEQANQRYRGWCHVIWTLHLKSDL